MVLPTEVPGLDDAADAWYDLEGIEPPVEEEKTPASSLPFGFGGESLTNVSRLPFGIGSHRDGIPFDVAQTIEPRVKSKSWKLRWLTLLRLSKSTCRSRSCSRRT